MGCFGIPLSKEPFTVADKQHQGSRCSFSDACGEASDSGSAIRVQPTRGSGYTVDPERRTEDGLSHAYLNNSSLSESETAVCDLLSKQFSINTQISLKPTSCCLHDPVGSLLSAVK